MVGMFLLAGLPGLISLGLVFFGRQTGQAEEQTNRRMPGRVFLGLSERNRSKQSQETGPEHSTGQREEWRAELPESNWQFIVLHHSASQSGSVQSIHREHVRRKDSEGNPWQGIGYHFVIGNGNGMNDGAVEATFRWQQQIHGAHSGNAVFNARGIGICLIGNFENTAPTAAQLESVQKLVKALATRHGISRENLMGHASVKPTACPGKHFPLKELREVIPKPRS
jgi:N-acetyl-anhydromuramyl-L-alanine amidase AmpD